MFAERHTHENPPVERQLAHTGHNILSDAFQHFGTRHQETVLLQLGPRLGFVALGNALLEGILLDRIRFASSARLVASHTVTLDKDTIDGNDFSRFEQSDITDTNILGVDQHLGSTADDLHLTVFALFVQLGELAFLLVIIDRANQDDDGNSDEDGNTFDPVDFGRRAPIDGVLGTADSVFASAKRLVETKSEGDSGSNKK